MSESATPHRVGPRRIVAIVIAALMLIGIGGLVGAALLGGDEPTGEGLQQPIDVAAPATADVSGSDPDDAATGAADAPAPPRPAEGGRDDVEGTTGGDDFAVGETVAEPGAAAPIENVTPLADDAQLPEPSEPVELPGIVVPPQAATTVATMTIDAFDPGSVAGLDGWTVSSRKTGYLQLTNGSQVVELFVLDDGAASAAEALAQFFGDMRPDLQEFTETPMVRLPTAATRYVSVAGSQFSAVSAGQQGTRTITGSAVAAIDRSGSAIVATASREGTSSVDQLTFDGRLLQVVLAHVAV